MGKGLFITATGTDVGKTFVTALLVKKLKTAGLSAAYYKAALSGAERKNGELVPGDAAYVKKIAGLNQSYAEMVSFVYEAAVSPHLAARIEDKPVDLAKVKRDYEAVKAHYDFVTVEGSGGIVCPIRWDAAEKLLLEDVIKALGLPLLIVASAELGTINSTVLTVEYARAKGLKVAGIILNKFHRGEAMDEDNATMIEELSGVKILAKIPERASEIDAPASTFSELYE